MTELQKSKPNGTTNLSDVKGASKAVELIRRNTEEALARYDATRSKAAKLEGAEEPESLVAVWREACNQQDTNQILKENMMQLQMIFQEMYVALYSDSNSQARRVKEIEEKLIASDDPDDWYRYEDLKKQATKDRNAAIKAIESMAKTIKLIATEYRAGEMAKAQFYHISEVRSLQLFIIAILQQHVHDKELLNGISDALLDGFSKMGWSQRGDVNA